MPRPAGLLQLRLQLQPDSICLRQQGLFPKDPASALPVPIIMLVKSLRRIEQSFARLTQLWPVQLAQVVYHRLGKQQRKQQ